MASKGRCGRYGSRTTTRQHLQSCNRQHGITPASPARQARQQAGRQAGRRGIGIGHGNRGNLATASPCGRYLRGTARIGNASRQAGKASPSRGSRHHRIGQGKAGRGNSAIGSRKATAGNIVARNASPQGNRITNRRSTWQEQAATAWQQAST